MATSVRCFSPIQATTFRLTATNACGVPVTGTGGAQIVASDGFVQAALSAQIDTGDRKLRRSGNGNVCINVKLPDILLGFTGTFDFCAINPGIIANTVNGRLLACSEAPSGTGFAIAEGIATAHFSVEFWQHVAGSGACDASGNQRYVYNALPHMFNARPGDYTAAEDPSTLQIIADSLSVSPLWTLGNPWLGSGCVQPVPDHWFQNDTIVPPPAALCRINDTVLP